MADLSVQYDALHGELAAMRDSVAQLVELNLQLKAVANGLPDNALGGAVLMGLVEYLLSVQQHLDQAFGEYAALVQAAQNAVQVIQEADSALQVLAPQ